ncbi:putative retroelement pol polyprotein, partial [Tanacetum coccineum]
MAIVMAVQKWRPYSLGWKFKVITDKKSLKFLLKQRVVADKYKRWISKLSGYDFEIVYRPGSENGAADALSRRGGDYEFSELTVAQISSDTSLLQAVRDDYEIVELRTRLLNGGDGLEGYEIVDGDVRYKGRLVLPQTSSLIPLIFREMHGGATGGHEGIQKTYQRMSLEFYWVEMRLLQPLNLPEQIWEELSMDFIDGLPKSEGYSVIMVVVDRLSKSAHFIPLKHPYTAASVAVEFIRGIVRLHGIPKSIVSDRDRVFISHFWKELFKYQGTQLKRSTAYHPQTDGQTEVVLYGRDPPTIMGYDKGVATTFEVDRYLLERNEVLDELKMHLRRAQQLMKVQADGKRRDVQFQVGDLIVRVGAVAYRLKLPATAAIHPVFHVAEPDLPVGLTEDMAVVCKPVEVIGTREGSEGLEVLVMWEGLTRDEATWERTDLLSKQFPAFHLEDK